MNEGTPIQTSTTQDIIKGKLKEFASKASYLS